MARGKGTLDSITMRQAMGKIKNATQILEKMQEETIISVWGGEFGSRMRLSVRKRERTLLWRSRPLTSLYEIDAKNIDELRKKIRSQQPDLTQITKEFHLPAGVPDKFIEHYWKQIEAALEQEITKQENRSKEFRTSAVRHNKLQIKGGKILLIRLGPLAPQRQDDSIGRRSPLKKGIWAFPYPYFEMFFAAHQIDRHMPRELQDWPEIEEEQEGWEIKRNQWIKKNAPRPKTFWYGGEIYTHYNKNGTYLGGDSWEKVTVGEFAKLFPKIAPSRYEANDELELFIPGKERGRVR